VVFADAEGTSLWQPAPTYTFRATVLHQFIDAQKLASHIREQTGITTRPDQDLVLQSEAFSVRLETFEAFACDQETDREITDAYQGAFWTTRNKVGDDTTEK
jgi:hypothetical protein